MIEIRKPTNVGIRGIFKFWLKNLEKEKPYLLIKRRESRSLKEGECTEVWYTIKHELNYLRKKLLSLDEEILELEMADTDTSKFTPMTIRTFELKKEVYDVRQKIKQLEKLPPDDQKLVMTYHLFNEITCRFNKKAIKAVIQGDVLNLNNRLGFLNIKKITRYSPSIDWGASRARRDELVVEGKQPRTKTNTKGEDWFVYRDSEYYLRWSWTKRFREPGIPMLKNVKLYAFYPTNNSSSGQVLGAKGLLAEANNTNQLLHLRYETTNYKTNSNGTH